MASTETVLITTNENVTGAVRAGANQLSLVAPLEGGATVSANVVKKVTRSSDADTFFGAGSKLAEGAKAAFDSGAPFVYLVGADEKTGSPFTDTFGAATVITTGTLANIPASSITSVTRDSTPITGANITFTHLDPTGETVAAGAILFNMKTGAFKIGTATTGSGPGLLIVYVVHDWSAAFDALAANSYEVVAPAGYTLTQENYGIYDKVLSLAGTENKIVAGSLDSGTTPDDIDVFATAIRNGRFSVLTAYHTGDLTSSWAAFVAKSRVNATAKEQPAPGGATYTDTYVRADYGDEESPASGTFHFIGINAVFKDNGGTFRVSNDRAMVGLTDFNRFKGTKRSTRFCEVTIEDDLLAVRRASDTAIPFTQGGLAVIRTTLESSIGFLRDRGIIDEATLIMPDLADIPTADIANRILSGVEVSVRLAGQVHAIELDLNVSV